MISRPSLVSHIFYLLVCLDGPGFVFFFFCLIVFVPLSVLHITLLRRYLLVPFLVGRICCISSFCGRALLGFHSLSHTLSVQLSGHSTGAAVIPFFSLVSQVGVGYYYYLLTLVRVTVIYDLATGILCGQQSTGCYISVHSFGVVWTLIYWFYFCVFLLIW